MKNPKTSSLAVLNIFDWSNKSLLVVSYLHYLCMLNRTLEERAQRLFSTKGKSLESLDPSLFAKNPKAKGPKKYVGVKVLH